MNIQVTNDILFKISDHLFSLENCITKFSDAEKIFFLIWSLRLEVDNGGFHQFFFNHSGEFAHETIASLEKASCFNAAKTLSKAISEFGLEKIPKEISARRRVLETVNTSNFRALDEEFYESEEEIDAALTDFAQDHMVNTVLSITMPSAIKKADEAFRGNNYDAVVEILAPYESRLPSSKIAKLSLAKKRVSGE